MGNASNAPLRSRLRLGLPSRPLLCRAPVSGVSLKWASLFITLLFHVKLQHQFGETSASPMAGGRQLAKRTQFPVEALLLQSIDRQQGQDSVGTKPNLHS